MLFQTEASSSTTAIRVFISLFRSIVRSTGWGPSRGRMIVLYVKERGQLLEAGRTQARSWGVSGGGRPGLTKQFASFSLVMSKMPTLDDP